MYKSIFSILLSVSFISCSNPAVDDNTNDNVPPVNQPANSDNSNTGTTNKPDTFTINDGIVTINAKIDASSEDRFGYRVLSIDMNHDGRDDLLVSAHLNRRYGASQGLVFVYIQNTDGTFNTVYDYTITPPSMGGIGFGASMVDIDWNNDGIEDLLVGAPYDDNCGGTNRGAVYVYYGESNGIKTGNYDERICNTSLANSSYFGSSLAKYDINQDGKEDLVIGAPRATDSRGTRTGQAYIFLNGASSASDDIELSSSTNNMYFGQSLAFADLNHDGFKDLLVSAYNSGGGKVYVYLHDGISDLASPHASTTLIQSAYDNGGNAFGLGLATLDIDGDGYDEVFISNPGLDIFHTNTGIIECFKDIDTSKTKTINAYAIIKPEDIGIDSPENMFFSYGISTINYNGTKTIASMLMRKSDDTNAYHSHFVILGINTYGEASLLKTIDNKEYMLQANSNFGRASAVGDIDGDGIRDLAISAYSAYTTYNQNSSGAVFIYKGVKDDTFISKPSYILYPQYKNNVERFGESLLMIDVNNDGNLDLLVGETGYDRYGNDNGVVNVFFGGKNFDSTVDTLITNPLLANGSANNDNFGMAMAKGDLNHDAHDDLIISAPYDDEEASNRGVVYIWRSDSNGKINYTAPPSQIIYPNDISAGNTSNALFGASLAVVDINPSGNNTDRNDLLIGVPGDDTDGTDSGRIYILYGETDNDGDGNPDGDGDNNFPTTVVGHISDPIDSASNYFGYSLAVGDYNGDNIKDLAVGSVYEDYMRNNSGSVFIYKIRQNSYDITTQNADIILHSNFNNPLSDEYWGSSLSFYDITGDGKDDLLIGAMNHSVESYSTGIEYIDTDLERYE